MNRHYPTLKQLLARVSLMVLGLCFGFFLLEMIINLTCSEAIFQEPHPIYGFFNIPNKEGWSCGDEFKVYVKINSKGLRDRDYSYEKAAGTYRVLVLGDSFTAAVQVPLEETFHKQLERLLNQPNQTHPYEVISSGVEDWGTGQELLFFMEEGYKYEPDLVLLMFYTGNDVLENSFTLSGSRAEARPYFTWDQSGDKLGPLRYSEKPREEATISSVKGVLRSSRLYWFARERLLRSPAVSRFLIEQGIMTNFSESYQIYRQDYPPDLAESWLVTQALLKAVRVEVEKRDMTLVVVLIPSLIQVNDELWHLARDIYLADLDQARSDRPDTLLLPFLEAEGIPYLHLLPHFRAQPPAIREQLYLARDGHWASQGHHLVSRLIYDYLLDSGALSQAE